MSTTNSDLNNESERTNFAPADDGKSRETHPIYRFPENRDALSNVSFSDNPSDHSTNVETLPEEERLRQEHKRLRRENMELIGKVTTLEKASEDLRIDKERLEKDARAVEAKFERLHRDHISCVEDCRNLWITAASLREIVARLEIERKGLWEEVWVHRNRAAQLAGASSSPGFEGAYDILASPIRLLDLLSLRLKR